MISTTIDYRLRRVRFKNEAVVFVRYHTVVLVTPHGPLCSDLYIYRAMDFILSNKLIGVNSILWHVYLAILIPRPKFRPKNTYRKRKAIMKKVLGSMLLIILLCATWGKDAMAQSSGTLQPSTKFVGWDVTKKNSPDITVTAVIQQVVPNHASGIPAGLHLMLGTPQGLVDASVGQFLPQQIQQALTAGQQIQGHRQDSDHSEPELFASARTGAQRQYDYGPERPWFAGACKVFRPYSH